MLILSVVNILRMNVFVAFIGLIVSYDFICSVAFVIIVVMLCCASGY